VQVKVVEESVGPTGSCNRGSQGFPFLKEPIPDLDLQRDGLISGGHRDAHLPGVHLDCRDPPFIPAGGPLDQLAQGRERILQRPQGVVIQVCQAETRHEGMALPAKRSPVDGRDAPLAVRPELEMRLLRRVVGRNQGHGDEV
jgi:hypothetical protein